MRNVRIESNDWLYSELILLQHIAIHWKWIYCAIIRNLLLLINQSSVLFSSKYGADLQHIHAHTRVYSKRSSPEKPHTITAKYPNKRAGQRETASVEIEMRSSIYSSLMELINMKNHSSCQSKKCWKHRKMLMFSRNATSGRGTTARVQAHRATQSPTKSS